MCLQGRHLIDVTVSDHLKLLFDTFKELIVAIIISVRGLGVSQQVSLSAAAERFGAAGCISSRGGLSSLGGASRMAARSFFSGDEFRCFPDTIPLIFLQITA